MKTTLVIMAAGVGSRYGGNKQTDGIGPHGERLMEYSIYDALRAGFRRIVFILAPGMRENMEAMAGNRIAQFTLPDGTRPEVRYACQDYTSLPSFFTVPEGRTKPFGTAHAVLCAEGVVDGPFCVINADDYYGMDAYRAMGECLQAMPPAGRAAMVGYVLKNTVSPGGTVSRGICRVEGGILLGITERLKIGQAPGGGFWDEDSGVTLSADDVVSMNLWGFAPTVFSDLRQYFERFLRTEAGENPKAECYLPSFVEAARSAGRMEVSVLESSARWFGMTYQSDREAVAEQLRNLHAAGIYPESLWG